MSAMASQITGVSIARSFVQAQIKANIKIPRHQPLNLSVAGFPSQRASDAVNVSIWWRHHAYSYWLKGAPFMLNQDHCRHTYQPYYPRGHATAWSFWCRLCRPIVAAILNSLWYNGSNHGMQPTGVDNAWECITGPICCRIRHANILHLNMMSPYCLRLTLMWSSSTCLHYQSSNCIQLTTRMV